MENDLTSRFSWQEWVEKYRWWILSGLLGLGLLGLGIQRLNSPIRDNRIEIIPKESVASVSAKLIVDIEGAVNKPGIYELPVGGRVSDLLDAAGGLAKNANVEWVAKSLNRAQKLSDGMKIYIFSSDEQKNIEVKGQNNATQGTIAGVNSVSSVSINSASQAELESLWGIGPATANALISGRPYSAIEELLSRKILKQNVYDKIREQLSL